MLQINTGKLFTRPVGRINSLRGVLYSNLKLPWRVDKIVTDAGTLLATDGRRENRAIVLEMEERIEAEEEGPGVLISRTIAPYLDDFATAASFFLNVVMSPDAELVSRLIKGQAGFGSYAPNSEFVSRFFDADVYVGDDDREAFAAFVTQLLALDRRTFLAATRSIKSYVAGLHRISDDLGLAYTLLVTSLESLAQGFDGHSSTWNDVDDRLRQAVDHALIGAESSVADDVKRAITEVEHTRLSRRFRAFVANHISAEYFRSQATGNRPLARSELNEALVQAYRLRSRYIHNVRALPDALSHPHNHWETTRHERLPLLTFQGLARLCRHVIINFVKQGQTVEREPYHYLSESAGVTIVQMAPECWVWQPLGEIKQSRGRLEGFLEQLASVMSNEPNAALTNLKGMLEGGASLLSDAKPEDRAAFVALLALYNFKVPLEHRSNGHRELLVQYGDDSDLLLSDNLIARTLLGSLEIWQLDQHADLHDKHFADAARGKGLLLSRKFDAAITMALAERHRSEGNFDRARELISFAVENLPGHQALQFLEQNFVKANEILFWKILFPDPEGIADESAT